MNTFVIVGQFIIGFVFVVAVINDFLDRHTLQALMDAKLESLLKRPVPQSHVLYYGGMALKAICGLALMFNILTSVAAFFLAGFMIVTNVVFNNFWAVMREERKSVFMAFLTNWAVIGGLVVLIAT